MIIMFIKVCVSAREALSLLLVPPSKAEPNEPPKKAIQYFDELEIYPGIFFLIFYSLFWSSTSTF